MLPILRLVSLVPSLAAQVRLLHRLAALQLLGRARQRNAARFQHVRLVGDVERHAGVLFNQQDGRAGFVDFFDDVEDFIVMSADGLTDIDVQKAYKDFIKKYHSDAISQNTGNEIYQKLKYLDDNWQPQNTEISHLIKKYLGLCINKNNYKQKLY